MQSPKGERERDRKSLKNSKKNAKSEKKNGHIYNSKLLTF